MAGVEGVVMVIVFVAVTSRLLTVVDAIEVPDGLPVGAQRWKWMGLQTTVRNPTSVATSDIRVRFSYHGGERHNDQ